MFLFLKFNVFSRHLWLNKMSFLTPSINTIYKQDEFQIIKRKWVILSKIIFGLTSTISDNYIFSCVESLDLSTQGSKGIRQRPINWYTSPMTIHKVNPSLDWYLWNQSKYSFSMASKPINIHWITTSSQTYWKIMYSLVLQIFFHKY